MMMAMAMDKGGVILGIGAGGWSMGRAGEGSGGLVINCTIIRATFCTAIRRSSISRIRAVRSGGVVGLGAKEGEGEGE